MGRRHSGSWKAFWFWGRLAWATGQEPPARRPSQVSDILSKFIVFGCKDFGGWDKRGRSKKRNGQQLCQVTSTGFFCLRKCWNYQILKEVSLCMSTWPENPFGSGLQRTTRWTLWRPSPVRVEEGLMILTSGTFGFNRRCPRCQDITVMWLTGHNNQLWFFLLNRKQSAIVVKANEHLLWYSIIESWKASADVHACVKLSKRRPPQAEDAAGVWGGAGSGGTRIYGAFILYLFQVEPWPSLAEGRRHLSVGGANKNTISE